MLQLTQEQLDKIMINDEGYTSGDTMMWCKIHTTLYRLSDGCRYHESDKDYLQHLINNQCLPATELQ